ncbi:structural maintenance of chromosomes protein 2-like isoform X1 [Ptychodera flava]|uniref:structural maintenance of chromosomes protein 2-like isoform X1 n=1 Tax=Ptychodera flava TaxID=63121 RepID=UPI00396AA0B2
MTSRASRNHGYSVTVSTGASDWAVSVGSKDSNRKLPQMATPRNTAAAHKTRRLGSPRTINSVAGAQTKFPPLSRRSLPDSRSIKNYNELQGALQITGIDTESPDGNTSPTRALTARSDTAKSEEIKDLQAKEKQYKSKIASLQKLVDQLKAELKTKQEENDSLQLKLQEVEQKYKKLYEDEKESHEKTKQELKDALELLKKKENQITELNSEHEKKIKEVTDKYENKLRELRIEKDREIAIRDQKLDSLKKKMAEALKDNSWERQQQLEELSKELARINEECRLLKSKMKALKVRDDNCQNCQALIKQVEEKKATIEGQEATIKQLATLCKKFELQLTQQDKLLKQWADSKGYDVGAVPNSKK